MDNRKDELIQNKIYKFIKNDKVPLNVTEQPTELYKCDVEELFNMQPEWNKIFFEAILDDKNFKNLPDTPIHNIFMEIKRRKKVNTNINLIYLRNDYMIDKRMQGKLIEINAQAISLNFMGPKVNKFHKIKNKLSYISNSDNKFVEMVEKVQKLSESGTIALMVDEKTDKNVANIVEKRMIIEKLQEKNIKMYHVTMNDIRAYGEFRENVLFYKKEKVFFVYYRYFYNYEQYTKEDIETRIKIESSTAVSLPNVELQILGLKHFQVFLEKNCKNKSVLKTFVKTKDIESYEQGDSKKYILKSYNEGGNSNLHDKDIDNAIIKGDTKGFLMKKVEPKKFVNILNDKKSNVVLEVGIFGYLISKNSDIIKNETSGYIIRTKDENSKECGINIGSGFLDTMIEK